MKFILKSFPSEDVLNQVVRDYKKTVLFEEIYSTMIKAIERRNRLEAEIADINLPDSNVAKFKGLKWGKTKNSKSAYFN